MGRIQKVRAACDRLEDGIVLPSLSICVLFAMAFAVASFGG